VSWLLTRSTSATIVALDAFSAYDVDPGDTGSAGPAQRLTVLEWVLQNGGTAGTVIPRVRAETGAQAVNIRAGSYGTYREAG
jgi:hypothetical protein